MLRPRASGYGASHWMVRARSLFQRCLGYGLGLAALCTAGPSHADTEAIHLEYRADPGCPTPEQFQRLVLARAPNARVAAANEPSRTFAVAIERDRAGYRGSLTVRELDGQTVARTVAGGRCREVASALALSTALAIDPTSVAYDVDPNTAALGEPVTATNGAGGSGSQMSSDASNVASDKAPPVPAAGADGGTSGPESPRDPTEYGSDYGSPPAAKFRAGLVLGPAVRTGMSPGLGFGVVAGLGFERQGTGQPLSFGLELTGLVAPDVERGGGKAAFELLAGRPQACWLLAQLTDGLRLVPCLGAEFGVVVGHGAGLPDPATQVRFWAAATIPVRLEARLSPRFLLEIEASAILPFTRYQFVFAEPESSVFNVPFIAAGGAMKLRFQP